MYTSRIHLTEQSIKRVFLFLVRVCWGVRSYHVLWLKKKVLIKVVSDNLAVFLFRDCVRV